MFAVKSRVHSAPPLPPQYRFPCRDRAVRNAARHSNGAGRDAMYGLVKSEKPPMVIMVSAAAVVQVFMKIVQFSIDILFVSFSLSHIAFTYFMRWKPFVGMLASEFPFMKAVFTIGNDFDYKDAVNLSSVHTLIQLCPHLSSISKFLGKGTFV